MKNLAKGLRLALLCVYCLQGSAHATLTEKLFEHCEEIPTLNAQLAPCAALLKSLKDNDDIHRLDGQVYNTPKTSLGALCHIGQSLEKMNVGASSFNLNMTRDTLIAFIDTHQDFAPHNPFLEYCHTKENLTPDKIKGFIHHFFQTLSTAYPQSAPDQEYLRILASCASTTALTAFQENEDTLADYPMQLLLHRIIENYTTQGGCVQGLVNRLFCAYTAILGALMER